MARHGEATAEQREAFAHALRSHLGNDPSAVTRLAETVGVHRVSAHRWQSGEREPQRREVFKIEQALGVPSGGLSHLLGYLPVGAYDVEQAILTDPHLADADRGVLLGTYRSLSRAELDRRRT